MVGVAMNDLHAPVLGLDLDNTIYDFCAAVRRTGERVLKRRFEVLDTTAWDLTDRYGVDPDTIATIFDVGAATGDLFTIGQVLPGRVEAVRDLVDQGWIVHVVTARVGFGHDRAVRAATKKWLAHNNVPYHRLSLTADKHLLDDITVLVDDTPEMVARQIAYRGPSAAVLIDADWNRNVDLPRVRCISELADAYAPAA